VLRDPGGAVVALTDNLTASSAKVVWHQLNTAEPGRAAENYAKLFSWSFGQSFDWGQLGRHRRFAFGTDEASVGLFSDLEGRPSVHAHWLFFFAVRSLDEAVQRVEKHGGTAIGPLALPNGVRVAACDDPQGAAFGLVQEDHVVRLVND
jgi:predicted enzyme related to lactoylglutathione lyase